MTEPIGRFSTLMISVKNMDEACTFYGTTMGLSLKFRDGDHWAAFDAGGITLALAGASERTSDSIALNFKVPDVEQALAQILAGGGRLESEAITGGHERRAAVRDCDGNLIHLYSPVPKPG